ncbi:preprotein translocase subunit SecD [Candidatus Falkowbacteria bacterium]|nr:preprotein translocase subunit SecD [Candidatus Falkowbacteria bacterium]
MAFSKKFSQLSLKARTSWILGLVAIFTLAVFLIAGGNYYNSFAYNLAKKTNDTIVLPQIKEIPFNLGLDLQGGTQLVYEADMTNIAEADRAEAMESARDIIERRVNAFGVSEPLVQANKGLSGEFRLIVELAGIKDVEEAIKMIGETPILEFKEQNLDLINTLSQEISLEEEDIKIETEGDENVEVVTDEAESLPAPEITEDDLWQDTGLTGKYLKRATLQFNPNDSTPEVSIQFNEEGDKLFAEITDRNVGRPVAIFLDGYIISAPTVNEKIVGGQALISGQFNIDEAKDLVKRLNSGALPVPISLVSQKTVQASLGMESINDSLMAGLIGLLLVSVFMVLVYRFPGLLSVISLTVYGLTMLAIFKVIPVVVALVLVFVMIALIFYSFHEIKIFDSLLALMFTLIGVLLFFYAINPITLSLSGIAGLILSLGMAVDANILIFARTKEEMKKGESLSQAITDGFKRAWPSIRDGNIVVLLTCLILMFFGTSVVQGFGTTLFIGVSVSLFSAIVVTRALLLITSGKWLEKRPWLLGMKKSKIIKE